MKKVFRILWKEIYITEKIELHLQMIKVLISDKCVNELIPDKCIDTSFRYAVLIRIEYFEILSSSVNCIITMTQTT